MNSREVYYLIIACLPLVPKITTGMRIVGEIPHDVCKITLFSWNNRYLIKLELGLLEQTFKVNQFDIASEAELHKIVDESFVKEAINRFQDMDRSLQLALERL
jgi:hypothetical protein